MKRRTRLLSLLLVLALLAALLPLNSLAAEAEEETPAVGTVTVKVVVGKKTLYTYDVEVGEKPVKLRDKKYIEYNNKYYEYSHYTVSGNKKTSVTIPAYDAQNADAWQKKWGETVKVVYTVHRHSYRFGYGRIHHWNICSCGHTTNEVRHVDPAKDADKICTCGYKFSDNADLTTLWLNDMMLSPRFNADVTEYTADIRTYLDVTKTYITAHSFDALATVTLPENLEVKEGLNTYQITVTAEDKTATKTYTVTAVKPVKVEEDFLYNDGTTVSAKLKTKVLYQIASATLSQAAADKLVEYAAEGTAVVLTPDFSKWGVKQTELTVSGAFLKALAEKTQSPLTVQTPYGSTLTVPQDQLTSLAGEHEAILIRIGQDNTYGFEADGAPLSAPGSVTLSVPAE